MRILQQSVLVCGVAMGLAGCLVDSIQPWLTKDFIIPAGLDLEGDWELVSEEFAGKYKVRLSKDRSTRALDKQDYYIKVLPQTFDSAFNFEAVVHQVNGIKLLQIENFSHFGGDVFSLANRPTVSLWQIVYDEDNIVIWAPAFPREGITDLKTMEDSNGKPLFIDSTENLQAYIENWTANYAKIKGSIKMIMPLIMTRAGTEFRMPDEMQALTPLVYKKLAEQDQTTPAPR